MRHAIFPLAYPGQELRLAPRHLVDDRDGELQEKCILGGGQSFVPILLPTSSGSLHVAILRMRDPQCPNRDLGLSEEESLQAKPDTCPVSGIICIASLGRWRKRFLPRRFVPAG